MPLTFASGGGDLRQRITFAVRADITDEYGNTQGGWADQFTCAAQITPRLGGETVDAARLSGRQPVVIRVRASTDTRRVRTDWKATDITSASEYNIRAVADPDLGTAEHGKWLELFAETGVAV